MRQFGSRTDWWSTSSEPTRQLRPVKGDQSNRRTLKPTGPGNDAAFGPASGDHRCPAAGPAIIRAKLCPQV